MTDVASGTPFGARLLETFDRFGHLCVGIDPHSYLLGRWGLDDSAHGVREFGLRVVGAAAGRVGIVKPQVAFFERHGSAGYEALERVIAAARDAGLLVIADAKRGDVGSSVEAYAQAWLRPGSPLEADAMTVSPFQGVGSLEAPLVLAREHGKGLFVLAATSNPESLEIQSAMVPVEGNQHSSVAASIVEKVTRNNAAPLGSVGVVIGATVKLDEVGISTATLTGTPILAPGFGFQGAQFSTIPQMFGEASAGVVVSSSRDVLESGPGGIASAIAARSAELAEVLAA